MTSLTIEQPNRTPRWLIWTLVAVVVFGVALVGYIFLTDDSKYAEDEQANLATRQQIEAEVAEIRADMAANWTVTSKCYLPDGTSSPWLSSSGAPIKVAPYEFKYARVLDDGNRRVVVRGFNECMHDFRKKSADGK